MIGFTNLLYHVGRQLATVTKRDIQEVVAVTLTSTILKSIGSAARLMEMKQYPEKFNLPFHTAVKRESVLLGISAVAIGLAQAASLLFTKNVYFKFAMSIPPLIFAEWASRRQAYKEDAKREKELNAVTHPEPTLTKVIQSPEKEAIPRLNLLSQGIPFLLNSNQTRNKTYFSAQPLANVKPSLVSPSTLGYASVARPTHQNPFGNFNRVFTSVG